MSKIALLVLLIIVALIWIRVKARGPRPPTAPTPSSSRAPERMLACVHCGLHLPAADAAFDAQGRAFCSGSHLDAHSGGSGRP